jgi:flavin reductase (DIM6/NTAB) family NADH-FMN oxidoreductase RutF
MVISGEHAVGISHTEFRRVLSHFASGVTVVTTCVQDVCHGITVSAFCSLSLEPPLVLICIDRQAQAHTLLREAGVFAVNVLAEDGERLSRLFASREPDKFAQVRYTRGQTGAPLLSDALATLECRLVDQYPGGDHTIFIGEVVSGNAQDRAGPLLYYRSGYHSLA